MVCSLGVTPEKMRDIRQGVGCGKEVLNDFRNAGTNRCVSFKAASASMFLTLVIGDMYACIFAWCMIHATLRRRGPIAVAVLTLPRQSQLSVAVLLTTVVMCYRGAMRGAKRWR